MHYHVLAEELITTGNELDGTTKKVWVQRFEDFRSTDFYLADPMSPHKIMFVPGKSTDIRRHVTVIENGNFNGATAAGDLIQIVTEAEEIPKEILAMAYKAKFNPYHPLTIFSFTKRIKKEMRYALFTLDVNEQVAILGLRGEGIGAIGEKVDTLSPVRAPYLLSTLYSFSLHSTSSLSQLPSLSPPLHRFNCHLRTLSYCTHFCFDFYFY